METLGEAAEEAEKWAGREARKVRKIVVRDRNKVEGKDMSDITDQLATLKANNEADATALADLETAVSAGPTDSVGDQVLAAAVPVVQSAGLVKVFGADQLKTALEAEGYTVTDPAAGAGATDTQAPPA